MGGAEGVGESGTVVSKLITIRDLARVSVRAKAPRPYWAINKPIAPTMATVTKPLNSVRRTLSKLK